MQQSRLNVYMTCYFIELGSLSLNLFFFFFQNKKLFSLSHNAQIAISIIIRILFIWLPQTMQTNCVLVLAADAHDDDNGGAGDHCV